MAHTPTPWHLEGDTICFTHITPAKDRAVELINDAWVKPAEPEIRTPAIASIHRMEYAPILLAAPDLIQERNALWDALSEILEDPRATLPKALHKTGLAAIEKCQAADAARGWELENEPPKGKG